MVKEPIKKKNYITPKGFQKLLNEQSLLLRKERPKVVETVAWAASNGDRSENADYIYGKKRLREIDSRLRFLQGRIESAVVVDPSTVKSEKVVFGAHVTFEDEEGLEFCYQIVGEDEWNIEEGKISWRSPVANALMGKKLDDQVVIQKPQGQQIVTITLIEFKKEQA